MARSESNSLVDRNENLNTNKHGTIVRTSSEGNREENASHWRKKTNQKRPSKDETGTKVGRRKEERYTSSLFSFRLMHQVVSEFYTVQQCVIK